MAILTAVCCSHAMAADAAGETARPNVVLVMADDQGYGDMGYNGHPFVRTPNFDVWILYSSVSSMTRSG